MKGVQVFIFNCKHKHEVRTGTICPYCTIQSLTEEVGELKEENDNLGYNMEGMETLYKQALEQAEAEVNKLKVDCANKQASNIGLLEQLREVGREAGNLEADKEAMQAVVDAAVEWAKNRITPEWKEDHTLWLAVKALKETK